MQIVPQVIFPGIYYGHAHLPSAQNIEG